MSLTSPEPPRISTRPTQTKEARPLWGRASRPVSLNRLLSPPALEQIGQLVGHLLGHALRAAQDRRAARLQPLHLGR